MIKLLLHTFTGRKYNLNTEFCTKKESTNVVYTNYSLQKGGIKKAYKNNGYQYKKCLTIKIMGIKNEFKKMRKKSI